MTNHRTPAVSPYRHYGVAIGKVLLTAAGLAALTHISWNMFAPDVFGLPEMRLKQALGLVSFGYVLAIFVRFSVARRGSESDIHG